MLPPVRLAVAFLAAAVAAIGAAPRILLAAGVLPAGARPFVWSDVLLVYTRGLSGHRLPYVDTPFEYPPLVGLVSGILSLASDGPLPFVALWSALLALLAGATAWILAGAASPRTVAVRFALAPQLLLLGSVNFDLLAVAFLSAALVRARRPDGTATGVLLGLGTLSKLFPLAAVPVHLARIRRPLQVGLILGAVVAAGYLGAALTGRSGAVGPLYYLVGIDANFDSPWGLVARGLVAAGIADGQSVVVALTLFGLITTYLLVVLRAPRAADALTVIGLAIVTTLLWSRLYSPQYSLWVLPLFALLPLRGRLFALLCAGDALVFATVYPLTLVDWARGDAGAATLLAGLVTGMVLRLIALTGTWRALHTLIRPAGVVRP